MACIMAFCIFGANCQRHRETPPPVATTTVTTADAAPSAPPAPPHVEELAMDGDLPAYLVRGTTSHALTMVFLAGLCARSNDYLVTYPYAAAQHGDTIGLLGDKACGDGTFRSWSMDLDALERRIDAALRKAGLGDAKELCLIGYSQGADRAERLAARRPERYTKLVLISSPIVSSAQRLGRAKAVLIGIGEMESRASTLRSVRDLAKAHVTTSYFVLPKARHGEMGPDGENVMSTVLRWLENPTTVEGPLE
jgi:pimeloyl-ACP methyl ester carboxylesterase